MYPKIIHQIWFQGANNVPSKYHSNISKMKQFHPNWEYKLWDEQSISNLTASLQSDDIGGSPPTFEHLHQKVDYARYVILHQLGGVYVDMDVVIYKPFDTLLEEYSAYEVIISKANGNFFENMLACGSPVCINNGIIISKPNSTFLKHLITEIDNKMKSPFTGLGEHKSITISRTTGPTMFTNVYNNQDLIDNSKIKLLHHSYLEPCFMNVCSIKPNTYAIHKHELSWIDDGFIKNIIIAYSKCRNYIPFIIILILIVVVRGFRPLRPPL